MNVSIVGSFSCFFYYRPQRSWGKVMFLHVSVILFTGGGTVSQHALQVVSPHALQQVSKGWGVVSQHALHISRPTPRGEVEGDLAGGGGESPGPHPRGKLREIWPGGVSRPTPKGGVEGDLARGVSKSTPELGSIPACTEAEPP